MSVKIRDKIGKLNPVQRKKVEDRAAELFAEEMSLRDLLSGFARLKLLKAVNRRPLLG